jgi:shikimate dehydrogenase
LNRTPARAESLARFLRERFSNVTIAVNAPDLLTSANLIVNATSMGLAPRVNESPMPGEFPPGAVVFDLVYRPAQTRFLRDAASTGARTIGGLRMLVHQGAAAFKLWTGRDAPVELMFQAARQALNGAEDAAFPYSW